MPPAWAVCGPSPVGQRWPAVTSDDRDTAAEPGWGSPAVGGIQLLSPISHSWSAASWAAGSRKDNAAGARLAANATSKHPAAIAMIGWRPLRWCPAERPRQRGHRRPGPAQRLSQLRAVRLSGLRDMPQDNPSARVQPRGQAPRSFRVLSLPRQALREPARLWVDRGPAAGVGVAGDKVVLCPMTTAGQGSADDRSGACRGARTRRRAEPDGRPLR